MVDAAVEGGSESVDDAGGFRSGGGEGTEAASVGASEAVDEHDSTGGSGEASFERGGDLIVESGVALLLAATVVVVVVVVGAVESAVVADGDEERALWSAAVWLVVVSELLAEDVTGGKGDDESVMCSM